MARSNRSIYAALVANIGIAITKFIAGYLSGSAAMISEAIHSTVDCSNELLLLLGLHRSRKKRDKKHPFGHGRELYFWSFIIGILIFGLGAGLSFYQGLVGLSKPRLTTNLQLNVIVLGIALLFEGSSFIIALKGFNKLRGDQSFWEAIKSSKDPASFLVLLEDFAAVIGIFIVGACFLLEWLFRNPYLDSVASLLIGCLLTFISIILVRESRSLLLGEGISAETEQRIRDIVKDDPEAQKVVNLFSIYQSPEEVLVVLIIAFREGNPAANINESIGRIKKKIREQFSKISYIVIQPLAADSKADGFTVPG
jgi:cation diffusion facilitator family transporter